MICPTCKHTIPHDHDTILCPFCGDELGECMPDGEPVRHLEYPSTTITDPKLLSPAVRQAIAFRDRNFSIGGTNP